MSVKELKDSIKQVIDITDDEVLLEAYLITLQSLLNVNKNRVAGYRVDGSPVSSRALSQLVQEASQRVKSGEYISQDELKQRLLDD